MDFVHELNFCLWLYFLFLVVGKRGIRELFVKVMKKNACGQMLDKKDCVRD